MHKDSGEGVRTNKLLQESFAFEEITWPIPVLSLPHTVGYKIRSPSFPFANANWELGLYPYGEEHEGYIELEVRRLDSLVPEHHVYFKFSFITSQGKEIQNYSMNERFNSESDILILTRFQKKSQFNALMSIFAPNGHLTVKCQMQNKIAEIDRSSQVQSTVFLSGIKTLTDFKQLFLTKENSDVVIKVKGQEFPTHRAILSARSPVFASTFRNDMIEKATGIVNIEDCDPSSFSDFLCFLYCGHIENLSAENVFNLFVTADKYDVQDLRSECMGFIKKCLSIETFCDIITLALQHSEKELIELSIDFFARNLQNIVKTVKWQALLLDNPIQCNELLIKALSKVGLTLKNESS